MRFEKILIPVTIIVLALVLVVAYSEKEKEAYLENRISQILETAN